VLTYLVSHASHVGQIPSPPSHFDYHLSSLLLQWP
jgi:hypothetical protein